MQVVKNNNTQGDGYITDLLIISSIAQNARQKGLIQMFLVLR